MPKMALLAWIDEVMTADDFEAQAKRFFPLFVHGANVPA